MKDNFELIKLGNGAWTVRSKDVGETFHPVVGPITEAEALYVDQLGLAQRLNQRKQPFVVWDVGLGGAGNILAFLTASRPFECPIEILSFDQSLAPLEFAWNNRERLEYLGPFEASVRSLLDRGVASF